MCIRDRHMDVAGVATATVISQAISAGLVVWCLVKVKGDYNLDLKKLRIYKDKLLGMTKIGLPEMCIRDRSRLKRRKGKC